MFDVAKIDPIKALFWAAHQRRGRGADHGIHAAARDQTERDG
jgi:hypothetical protein